MQAQIPIYFIMEENNHIRDKHESSLTFAVVVGKSMTSWCVLRFVLLQPNSVIKNKLIRHTLSTGNICNRWMVIIFEHPWKGNINLGWSALFWNSCMQAVEIVEQAAMLVTKRLVYTYVTIKKGSKVSVTTCIISKPRHMFTIDIFSSI